MNDLSSRVRTTCTPIVAMLAPSTPPAISAGVRDPTRRFPRANSASQTTSEGRMAALATRTPRATTPGTSPVGGLPRRVGLRVVGGDQVLTPVASDIAQHRVDMVRPVLRVVVLDQECRSFDRVVVSL